MIKKGKIINDPVYGFMRFPEPEVMQLIDHPWFQRLRYIKQMGPAQLVYPGAVHTRFHHSLGACHLMSKALHELRIKDVEITEHEALSARIAILLHDIGHGPFSHALEHALVKNVHHETISQMIMQSLNDEFQGALTNAINIFNESYPKQFLHQLVSSQLDVDRMDYLSRDSFYTGVSEGVIGYDRILQMLTVVDNQLMVEEKGVHSIEKFLIARRLMYWQVYIHKTVLGAEVLLTNILKRAKELAKAGEQLEASPALKHFLYNDVTTEDFHTDKNNLEYFCQLDDADIMVAVKSWAYNKDSIISTLCKMLLNRQLYKVILSSDDISEDADKLRALVTSKLKLSEEAIDYYVTTGKTSKETYSFGDERIQIAMKNGEIRDISSVNDPVISSTLAMPVHKNYICFVQT